MNMIEIYKQKLEANPGDEYFAGRIVSEYQKEIDSIDKQMSELLQAAGNDTVKTIAIKRQYIGKRAELAKQQAIYERYL